MVPEVLKPGAERPIYKASPMNAYATAGKAYTESSVLTAPPERLVVMLYDGAIRFLTQSAAAMRHGDRQKARERMRRAEAIIDELNVVLDMEKGGKIARDLRSIYLFAKRTLTEATTKQEPHRIDAVVKMLSELRGSWETLAANAGA